MIKAFIFDLDGVICSTDEFHYEAWKALADEENIYFDKTINNRLRGVSRMESLEIILEKANRTYSKSEKEKLAFKKNEIYKNLLTKMDETYCSSEVKNTLKEIKKAGYKVAIGSSSKNTKLILTRINLMDYFDVIVDGNDIINSKPDPEVFLKAAERLNVLPCEAYVIEDAFAGIEAGHNGGFKTIAIGDAKKSNLCDFKIDSFGELVSFIK